MLRRREQLVAAAAVVVVAAVVVALITLVTDVQRRGRRALERERRETVEQLADSMNTRVEQALAAMQGLGSAPYSLEPADPKDRGMLEALRAQQPQARAGYVLVDARGVVVNGVLLQPSTVIGEPLDRPGLADVLERGLPAILPVADGVTTAGPALGLAAPILDTSGHVRGAFLAEADVAADSSFNEEVANLGRASRGTFSYVDPNGVVVASTDHALLGRKLDDRELSVQPGLHRVEGRVIVVGEVPSASWRTINVQDVSAFEEGLGRRTQQVIAGLVMVAASVSALVVTILVRRLRAAREEQRRLRELNRAHELFTRMISHELRTPVAGVLGFLQTATDHWDAMSEPERRAAVERALASARRLNAMTRDVMDTASVEEGALVLALDEVDVVDEVQAAVQALRDLQPQRPVEVEIAERSLPLEADPDRLQQVLAYLLDNAARHSPSSSPIAVRVAGTGEEVHIEVTDQGPAVPGDVTRLFEKFAEARGPAPATGFALYLARRIVEGHGGRIWAESREGAGTTFGVALPLHRQPVDAGDDGAAR